MDNYITVKEIAEKWGISIRRVQKLCSEDRIPFAKRFGNNWAIPEYALKPLDGRSQKTLKMSSINCS